MLTRRKKGWELRESEATPEAIFVDRRALIKAIAAGPIVAPAVGSAIAAAAEEDPSANLYPAKRNPRYTLDRPITEEKLATTYNNFYEFGSQKTIAVRRSGAEDPTVDDQDRRARREADDGRYR